MNIWIKGCQVEGEDAVIEALHVLVERLGTRKKLAEYLNVSAQKVSEILNRQRHVPVRVAERVGFDKVVVYRSRE